MFIACVIFLSFDLIFSQLSFFISISATAHKDCPCICIISMTIQRGLSAILCCVDRPILPLFGFGALITGQYMFLVYMIRTVHASELLPYGTLHYNRFFMLRAPCCQKQMLLLQMGKTNIYIYICTQKNRILFIEGQI